MTSNFDTVVVGGGIIGLAAAYRLAREGARVVLLEKDTVGFQASSRNAGGILQQFKSPALRELAKASVEVWRNLSEEISHDLEFKQAGSLRLAMEPEDLDDLRRGYEADLAAGLPVEHLTPEELAERIPVDPSAFIMANACSSDAQANPVATCEGMKRAAIAASVDVREGSPATSITTSGNKLQVRTGSGELTADTVIVAAGPWSAELLEPLGVTLPFALRRPQMAETTKLPPLLDGFIGLGTVRGHGYGRQTASGTLNFGVRNLDAALDAPEPTYELIRNAFRVWERLLPSLSGVQIKRTWSGFTVWTPDKHPNIGAVPGVPGLFVGAGFCGQGFGASAAVGGVLRDLVLERQPVVDVHAFDPSRFGK